MLALADELPALPPSERARLLRDSVCAAVDELRASGRSSARAVQILRELATDAGIAANNEDVMNDFATWCTDRYYAPTNLERRPKGRP